MNEIVYIALLIGMYFTGACVVNFMMQDFSEDIDKPYDLTYSVAFLFGMLAVMLIKMI